MPFAAAISTWFRFSCDYCERKNLGTRLGKILKLKLEIPFPRSKSLEEDRGAIKSLTLEFKCDSNLTFYLLKSPPRSPRKEGRKCDLKQIPKVQSVSPASSSSFLYQQVLLLQQNVWPLAHISYKIFHYCRLPVSEIPRISLQAWSGNCIIYSTLEFCVYHTWHIVLG